MNNEYMDLEKFSRDIGIPKENLVKAFEIERDFHSRILKEKNREKRKQMYNEVYNRVHPILETSPAANNTEDPKKKIVRLFRKELERKSILDVGCGQGDFLRSVAFQLDPKRLVGIDISDSILPKNEPSIEFINCDIVDFDLNDKFEVIFSDQVLEHIAPADLPIHLSSIRRHLSENGMLIILMPNRLFGPSDVTRIIDYTYTNQIEALGTHLNEQTYTELIPILKKHGFQRFWTALPTPINYLFPNIRLNLSIYTFIENSPFLLRVRRRISVPSS